MQQKVGNTGSCFVVCFVPIIGFGYFSFRRDLLCEVERST
jgi:hypothetical protein